jgi:hypothetical protein
MGQVTNFNIGDLVRLKSQVKKSGKKSAISAWKKIYLHGTSKAYGGRLPEDSSLYDEWFNSLCGSAAIVVDNRCNNIVVEGWIRVRFLCFDQPFWTMTSYFKKCG